MLIFFIDMTMQFLRNLNLCEGMLRGFSEYKYSGRKVSSILSLSSPISTESTLTEIRSVVSSKTAFQIYDRKVHYLNFARAASKNSKLMSHKALATWISFSKRLPVWPIKLFLSPFQGKKAVNIL